MRRLFEKSWSRALILLCLGLKACGYAIRRNNQGIGGLPSERAGLQRIYIPVVDNMTMRIGIEPQITSSLRETLAGVQGVQVVNSEAEADYLLLGTLMDYTRVQNSAARGDTKTETAGGLTSKYGTAASLRVEILLSVKLLQKAPQMPQGRRLVWARSFSRYANYDTLHRFYENGGASSAPNFNNSREQFRIRGLADAIARQIVDQVVQDF